MGSREPERVALAQQLTQGALALRLSLSADQVTRLLDYVALLVKWNAVYNLTAVREPAQMVSQHLLDSLAVLPAFAGAQNVLDVGAGGGLPGIVLAIWAAEAAPAMQVSLIDTVHKKTAFLTQAKAQLGLNNISVYTGRVEQLQVTRQFDVITARAFAELADFVTWSGHLLAPGGRFLAMKGVLPTAEIARLPAGWDVTRVLRLQVPGLEAERHLICIEKNSQQQGESFL